VRDVILFGPQLVLQSLGQMVRQSLEFVVSGASPEDAKGVNIAFRTSVGPREDRPFDTFPNFINLKTVIWIVGLVSVILNVFALSNLDMLNVLLLLPSLLFSVSTLVGPFVLKPPVGNQIGKRVGIAKLFGWLATLVFYTAVSLLIAQGGWLSRIGVVLLVAVFALLARHALKYFTFRSQLRRTHGKLQSLLTAAGAESKEAETLATQIMEQTGGDPAKVQATLKSSAVAVEQHAAIVKLAQEKIGPLVQKPVLDSQRGRFANSRFVSEFNRAFALSLFVLIWFFIVPVPGLFVFTAGPYRLTIGFWTIMQIVGWTVALALASAWIGRFVQWLDRRGALEIGLSARMEKAFQSFQSLLHAPGKLTEQEIASAYALFTDAQTYIDQRSYEYVRRTLGSIETILGGAGSR